MQVNLDRTGRPLSVADRFKMELHQRSILISGLHFLHQRMGSMLSAMAARERSITIREVLMDQQLTDRHIAKRLSAVAGRHGMAPRLSANVSITAALEEVRFADLNRSAPEGRSTALRNAIRSVRIYAISLWSELLDAADEHYQAELRQEVLALQTAEADLYRALDILIKAPVQ